MFSNYQISMDKQVFRLFGSVLSILTALTAVTVQLRLGLSAINVLDASDEVVDT